jgi:hypothetical protein
MFLEWYHLSKNAGGNCPDYLGRAKLMKPQFSLCENGITNTDCLIGNQTILTFFEKIKSPDPDMHSKSYYKIYFTVF